MTRRPAALLGAVLALTLTLTACSGSGDDEAALRQEAAPSPTAQRCETTPPTTPPPASLSSDLTKKPEVDPEGVPPCGLVVSDVVVGKGAEAVPGKTVSVQYVGVDHKTGQQFDASWDRGGEPFSFALGAGQVIPGWDQGVAGMKVGGRRMLVIPPELAYGEQGTGPIGPNATLVFVVDLKGVA